MLDQVELAGILSALPDPVFILSRSGFYRAVFGGRDERYYHDGRGLVGLNLSDVLHETKASWFLQEIATALASARLHIVEYELSARDLRGLPQAGPDHVIWFEGRVQRLPFAVEGEDAVLWVASNMTERHELELRLRHMSQTDALTGLANRRHFNQMLDEELERSRRYGHPVSLLIFDVDYFKTINDRDGHGVGDHVLVQLSELVHAYCRESDVVARWGGEEFMILMPHTDLESACHVAEKIRAGVEGYRFVHARTLTLSLGVATWQAPHEPLQSFLVRLDKALYRAKEQGRNGVVCCVP